MSDIGYSPSVIWAWTGEDRASRTTSFQPQFDLIGERLIELLNATKRVSQYSPGTTIRTMIYTLRVVVAAIARNANDSESVQAWADALIKHLQTEEKKSERTRWSVFNAAGSIFKEAARARRQRLALKNPFDRYLLKNKSVPRSEDLEPVIRQAKRDVVAYMRRFRETPAEHAPFVERARAIAYEAGGILPHTTSGPAYKLRNDWRNKVGLPLSVLTGYLYPSAKDLAPFLLLITHALAGNVDSVAFMRRDAITPFDHPAYGECFKLKLEKPRAGDISPYLLRGSGTLSVGSLILMVLEITARLVPLAVPQHRNFAFLTVAEERREVTILLGNRRTNAFRRYLKRNGFSYFQLRSLRSARALDEYEKSRDPFRIRRMLKQGDIAVTLQYLDAQQTHDSDAVLLADIQRSIIGSKDLQGTPVKGDDAVQLASHLCGDPFAREKPVDQSGLCAGIGFPFNDRNFVLDLSPRPIAFLLREYAALTEAQKTLAPERFARKYAARKALIEREAMPLIGEDLRSRAEAVLATLPALPHID